MLKQKAVDMTEGVIWRQLTAYAVPILIGELFQQFYVMVDSAIVGNFVGATALGAIGASDIIVRVLVGFFNGMAVGFTVVIARYFGAKDRAGMDTAVNTVLQTAFLFGLAITAGGLLLAGPILGLLDTPAEVLPHAAAYLRIYFAGIMGFVLYNTAAAILRAVGDVRTPLFCLLFSSVLNILLDLALVAWFHFGVAGAAIATIFSQCLAALISLRALARPEHPFTTAPLRHPFSKSTALLLLRLGIPTGFQKTITSLSNVLVLSRIIFFGEGCLAGWVVYNKLDNIFTIVAQSVGSSLSTFVSQNLGAKKYQRLEKGVRETMLGGTGVFLVLITGVVLLRGPLVRFFGSDPEMLWYAGRFVLILTWCKLAQLLMNVYAGALRGTGRMTLVTVVMLSGIVAFRQLYLSLLPPAANTPWMVGLSYPAGWAFAGVILLLVYLFQVRAGWRRLAAQEEVPAG